MDTCRTCKFCVEDRCRKEPPKLQPLVPEGHWPIIKPTSDWCGAYEQKSA
jgi:hypothetical protein